MDLQDLVIVDSLLAETGLTAQFWVDPLTFAATLAAHGLHLLDHSRA